MLGYTMECSKLGRPKIYHDLDTWDVKKIVRLMDDYMKQGYNVELTKD